MSNKFFLLYITILFSIFERYEADNYLDYHHSITLLNFDIFVISKEGISIYNSSMSKKEEIEHFTEDISNNDDYNKITISRFSEKRIWIYN